MDKRRWGSLIGLLIIAGFIGYTLIDFFKPAQIQIQADTGVTVDSQLPVFTLAGLDGQQVTVGRSGSITVINFWATWCPPCREEMPGLNAFFLKHRQEIRFYAVNIQEPAAKVHEFIQQHQYGFPVLLDQEAAVSRIFLINAIPTTLVADQHGIIRYRKAGSITRQELEAVIGKLQG